MKSKQPQHQPQQQEPLSKKNPWLFESFDLTVSTVDSDGLSVSSCSNDSASSSSSLNSPLIFEESLPCKRVSFEENEQGKVQCYTKVIERCNNPELWWSHEESQDILRDCLAVVDYYKGRPRLCTSMTNLLRFKWLEDDDDSHPLDAILDFLQDQDPEVLGRGLEQHIVGSSKHYVARHRQAVLMAQDEYKGTIREASVEVMLYIAECAATTSDDCKELARSVGIYDEVEAYADELDEDDYY